MIGLGIAKTANLLSGYEPELYGPSTNGALSDQLALKQCDDSKPRKSDINIKELIFTYNNKSKKMQPPKKESLTGSNAQLTSISPKATLQRKSQSSADLGQKLLKSNQESVKNPTLVKTSTQGILSHRSSLALTKGNNTPLKNISLNTPLEKPSDKDTKKNPKKDDTAKVNNDTNDARNPSSSKESATNTTKNSISQKLGMLSSQRSRDDISQILKTSSKEQNRENVSSLCNTRNTNEKLGTTAKKQNEMKGGSCNLKRSDSCLNGQSQLSKSSKNERESGKTVFDAISHVKESLLLPGENRVYHLRVQSGDLYNRILVVGHAGRADLLAQRLFDLNKARISFSSNHFFRVHSGYYKNTRVSIVSVGMGAPMMDIFVREASLVTEGTLAIIRLGTCMLLNPKYHPGSLVVCEGSVGCYTNYSYFDSCFSENDTPATSPYTITKPCLPNPELNQLLINRAEGKSGSSIPSGINVSCENYYSCQCRAKGHFRDENENLWKQILSTNADTMEMDTHQLLHLANRRKKPIHAAAIHVGLTNRMDDTCVHPITPQLLNRQILVAACASLEALISHTIE